ncbi:MAG: RHS repeat-associated core domain-containing protein [Cyclobacteriaceae bacterium]
MYITNEETEQTDLYFDDFKITHTPTIVAQTDSYYPFGLSHGNMSYVREGLAKNQFLYNGKELVEGFDLGWYDYGARYYAADLGRWHAVDPLAEKYHQFSPYNYVVNNPIMFIDPDGEDVVVAFGGIDYQSDGSTGSAGNLINNLNNWAAENGIQDFSAKAFASDYQDAVLGDAVNFIRENYDIDSGEKLIIYGYSWGRDTGVELTEML